MPAPVPPRRSLAARPLAALAAAVRRFPALVVVAVTGLTAAMAGLAGQADTAVGNEGMNPDHPKIAAAEELSERFGTDDEVLQVLVEADRQLVGDEGLAAAESIQEAVLASDAADRLAEAEGRPAVVTWMFPAQRALAAGEAGAVAEAAARQEARPGRGGGDDGDAASAGTAGSGQDAPEADGPVSAVEAYEAGLAALPDGEAAMAEGLLPDGAVAHDAERALALVFLDGEGLAEDWEERLEVEQALDAAVAGADLPEGMTASAIGPGLLFAEVDDFDDELSRLFTGAFATILVILAFVYWVRPAGLGALRAGRRSAADVALSMAAIVMAILWMQGIGALLGPGMLDLIGPTNQFAQVIPVLMIGLGVDYAIHVTSRYREELGAGAGASDGMGRAIGSVGGALVLATLATALGFLTNVLNPVPALQDFGVLAAVGIAAAFLLMLTFVPAVRLLADRRADRAGRLPTEALGRGRERLLPKLMARSAVLARRAPAATLAVTAALAGLGAYGLSQLEVHYSDLDMIPEDSERLAAFEAVRDDFAGGFGETTEVLVTGELATPEAHNALVALHDDLAGVDDVVVLGGQAMVDSPASLVAELAAVGEGPITEAAHDAGLGADLTVAEDADVARLHDLAAAAAPEAAAQVLDGEAARLAIQTSAGEEGAAELDAALDDVLAPLEEAGLAAVATSQPIIVEAIIGEISDAQASSLVVTLATAALLLAGTFAYELRRPALGLITVAPVVLVVLWTFGAMAATGIPFGPITATIAAVAIGIGLPYAIHVTHRFLEDRERHDDVGAAVASTVRHTGGALAGSALTTMAGFGILVTSTLLPFRQLGLVTVYAVGFAVLAATLVLPSLLVLWDRWHRRGEPAAEPAEEPALAGR